MKNLFYFTLGCVVGSYVMYNKLYKYVVNEYITKNTEQTDENDD